MMWTFDSQQQKGVDPERKNTISFINMQPLIAPELNTLILACIDSFPMPFSFAL